MYALPDRATARAAGRRKRRELWRGHAAQIGESHIDGQRRPGGGAPAPFWPAWPSARDPGRRQPYRIARAGSRCGDHRHRDGPQMATADPMGVDLWSTTAQRGAKARNAKGAKGAGTEARPYDWMNIARPCCHGMDGGWSRRGGRSGARLFGADGRRARPYHMEGPKWADIPGGHGEAGWQRGPSYGVGERYRVSMVMSSNWSASAM
jgi:hypothetical protein